MSLLRLFADQIVSLSGRNLIAHDRILSAVSEDGASWKRESGIRVGARWGSLIEMAYYPFVVSLSPSIWRMYFYGGTRRRGWWQGGIYSALSSDGVNWRLEPGIRVSNAPSATARAPSVYPDNGGWMMYFVEKDAIKAGQLFSAYSKDGLQWGQKTVVDIQGLGDEEGVSDALMVELPDGQPRLYISAKSKSKTAIRSARSTGDGSWEMEPGWRIANQPGMMLTANNPSVFTAQDGSLKMIFRGGDSLAVGNALFLAQSVDGLKWEIVGRVLSPSRSQRYEQHGLGFPHVHSLPDGGYRLYYTGYWGRTWREKKLLAAWREATQQALSEPDAE